MIFNHIAVQNEPDVTVVIMSQISLKTGLKTWDKKGKIEVHSDMKQIHMKDTLIPLHRKDVTKEQRNTIID